MQSRRTFAVAAAHDHTRHFCFVKFTPRRRELNYSEDFKWPTKQNFWCAAVSNLPIQGWGLREKWVYDFDTLADLRQMEETLKFIAQRERRVGPGCRQPLYYWVLYCRLSHSHMSLSEAQARSWPLDTKSHWQTTTMPIITSHFVWRIYEMKALSGFLTHETCSVKYASTLFPCMYKIELLDEMILLENV